ncbi:cell death protein 3-like isoform X2 [Ylistrum balloti]|uniref:cell death protein 3-like isoform X2 n=1 Tax=Ylistrum balloti TaxID=509963 RepID=UPI0029058059|nr:cell death protein 3-like isoform X2 [Ylistrum balloti]
MEKIHKDALRKTRIRLVQDLHPDAEVWDMLVTESIFTPIMMEYIQAERTRADKVRRLLDDLVRRGPKAYQKFLKCLRKSEHEDLANAVEDNEYILRGLPVPFRAGTENLNRNVQGNPDVEPNVPSSVSSQNNIKIEQIPSQESEEESMVFQESNVTHCQPSEEGEAGQASLACSLVTPSGFETRSAANQNPSPQSGTSHIIPGNSTSQPGSHVATGVSPSQPETSTSQSGSLLLTSNSTAQSSSPTATGNKAGQEDEDDDIIMTVADVQTPEIREVPTAYQRAFAERPTYRMESNPRGFCLIINNRDYTMDSLMDPRTGTDVNRNQLSNLFKELGFHVDTRDNLTGEDMRNTLRDFAIYPDLSRVDSLIVAFLCHGNSEKLFGVDGVPIYIQQDVFKVFSPRECPLMKEKPKLILMNSCRGDKRDVGCSLDGIDEKTSTTDAAKTDIRAHYPDPRNDTSLTASFQDLYIAYSTFSGHVSYRNSEEGSWYIQKLVEVFREQAAFCDINAMMTQVNRRVANMYDPSSMEVQVPAPCQTLTKDWFFNPPTSV